jgi:dihydrodipicolinate synthase/N-acetylneuraminate lyase
MKRLQGAIAAVVTPLGEGGASLEPAAIPGLSAYLADGGVDGALVCGTTGEGVLLSVDERRQVTQAFIAARPGAGFAVAVHAGAQTTADTCALAAHARDAGADAVAVIGPPYYPLDRDELTGHFVAAARACDPLPFYLYEFVARSGYAIPLEVVDAVRRQAPNLAGLKVSDTPFDAVRPYLGLGLDVFIGLEPLALEGLAAGAVGSVSGLASAFPGVVASLVHERSEAAHGTVKGLRNALQGIPFQAALKQTLVDRGVLTHPDVRPPLRALTADERARVSRAAQVAGSLT